MAAITTSGRNATSSGIATAEEIRSAFVEHKQELTWLAEFLTNDELMASACIADAGDLSKSSKEDEIDQECARSWPREATIRSAVDFKRMRIAELSCAYEGEACGQQHPPLSQDAIELVVRESEVLRLRLDSLCRFALILCGFEQHPAAEAARLLGISKRAVESAYGTALESLEIVHCQEVLESYGCAAA